MTNTNPLRPPWTPERRAGMSKAMKAKWSDTVWVSQRQYKVYKTRRKPFKASFGKQKCISLYVTESQFNIINEACDLHQLSKTDLIRSYIEWGLANDKLDYEED
jgi:hypothetical protein